YVSRSPARRRARNVNTLESLIQNLNRRPRLQPRDDLLVLPLPHVVLQFIPDRRLQLVVQRQHTSAIAFHHPEDVDAVSHPVQSEVAAFHLEQVLFGFRRLNLAAALAVALAVAVAAVALVVLQRQLLEVGPGPRLVDELFPEPPRLRAVAEPRGVE